MLAECHRISKQVHDGDDGDYDCDDDDDDDDDVDDDDDHTSELQTKKRENSSLTNWKD